jgi:uncharacterized protein YndB with AHSA1/START domain
MPEEARRLELSLTIEATPEEVWRAITEGDAITRWFAPEAEVDPGMGGTILLSWGPGMEGTAPITAWEPGRRFAWTERAGSDLPKVSEFIIEASDGGKTVLRLIQSGFGPGASFDAEYDSTSGGWRSFLQLLRLDLEAHRGMPGRHIFRMLMGTWDAATLMETLLRSIAFQREGEQYLAEIASGLAIRGSVLFERTPGYLILSMEAPLPGALGLFAENAGGQTALTTSWYLKGGAVEQADKIQTAWDSVLDGALDSIGVGR